LMTTLTTR